MRKNIELVMYRYFKYIEKVDKNLIFISYKNDEEIKKDDIPKKLFKYDDLVNYFKKNNVKEIEIITYYRIDVLSFNIDMLGYNYIK